MDYDNVFWIKFAIVSIPLMIGIWWMAPTMKWKVLFTLCVPIGVWLALSGRSMKGITPLGRSGY